MDAAALIAQIRAQREQWLELRAAQGAVDGRPARPALEVKVRRPAEAEMRYFFGPTRRAALENVQAYVVDWRGFTEAELLGQGIGASDPVPFDAALWSEIVADRMAWVPLVFNRLVEMINAHSSAVEDLEKKSPPSSTPGPASKSRAKTGPSRTQRPTS